MRRERWKAGDALARERATPSEPLRPLARRTGIAVNTLKKYPA
ncbi:hypothetical protein [Solihabitans fulvus]|nr:hypothetical protein [Solihabitans fulvus]